MIKWITEYLATGAFSNYVQSENLYLVDVRDLVDKAGNSNALIRERIDFVLSLLQLKKRVVICCDYGMSRSNAIAAGALCKFKNISFNEALQIVMDQTKEEIKLDILKTVEKAIDNNFLKNEKGIHEKKILVLGGHGDVGREVVSVLRLKNKVLVPTRQELDISQAPIFLDKFCVDHNVTHILNLAYPKIFHSHGAFKEAIGMLHNVLEVLKNQPHIHMTYLSGLNVFSGYKSKFMLANEETPLNADCLHGESRYFCEKLIEYYTGKYNFLKIAIIRTSVLYGTRSKPKFIYNFINKAFMNEDIYTHSYINHKPYLHLTHIQDLAEALSAWFQFLQSPKGIYHVAGDEFVSTYNIAEKVIKILGSKSKIITQSLESYTSNVYLDTLKFRQEFSWKSAKNLDCGLYDLINKREQAVNE